MRQLIQKIYFLSLQNIGGDEFKTLVSLDSLTSPSDEPSVESFQEKYRKLETEKDILQVDLQELKIESEKTKQDYHQMEEDHNKLLQKLADVEQKQAQAQDDALANSEQVAGLTQQLQVQTEALSTLKEELDNVRQEREVYKNKLEELELIKVGKHVIDQTYQHLNKFTACRLHSHYTGTQNMYIKLLIVTLING